VRRTLVLSDRTGWSGQNISGQNINVRRVQGCPVSRTIPDAPPSALASE
jgi:hypothetical protein